MGPYLPRNNPAHSRDMDAVFGSESLRRGVATANTLTHVSDEGIGQFGLRVGCSARIEASNERHTPLSDHVGDIVDLGTLEQMPATRQGDTTHFVEARVVVPDTGAVITGMADDILGGENFAGRKLPREAMGGASESVADAELSVALAASRSGPQPALAALIDVRPEALLPGGLCALPSGRAVARTGAVPPRVARAGSEKRLTLGACVRGIIRVHRDLPFSRNRGACPGLLTQARGVSLWLARIPNTPGMPSRTASPLAETREGARGWFRSRASHCNFTTPERAPDALSDMARSGIGQGSARAA